MRLDSMNKHPVFINKKILIFSPQPWNFLYISKHHYALELAKQNDVWFISAPEKDMGLGNFEEEISTQPRLKVIHYRLPVSDLVKFHMKPVYKWLIGLFVKKSFLKVKGGFDACIDFGCYSLFDSQDFVKASVKIFFPVDHFDHVRFTNRGAQYLFTVSDVIKEKFSQAGINCHFINHGLSEEFATLAKERLNILYEWKEGNVLKVGYTGNLFSHFLDINLFKKLIIENPDVEFHLFGGFDYGESNSVLMEWLSFLQNSSNVKLLGFLRPGELAKALQNMDALVLCYKPDYKNYFGENTHKMLEYLSTGKAIISTHITLYANSEFIEMTNLGQDEDLPVLFRQSLKNLKTLNSQELYKKRISFALNNTYAHQIERIGAIIAGGEEDSLT